jgi:hypothetical protein
MSYSIEKKEYGIRITFEGMLDSENANKYVAEFLQVLNTMVDEFGIIMDLTKAKPMPEESQVIVDEAYKAVLQKKGMNRAASIVSSTIMKIQMVRMAKEHGIYDKARYIDATTNVNYEKAAIDWVERGIDPDQ